MKKILFLLVSCLSFGFNVYASSACNPSAPTVPCSYNGAELDTYARRGLCGYNLTTQVSSYGCNYSHNFYDSADYIIAQNGHYYIISQKTFSPWRSPHSIVYFNSTQYYPFGSVVVDKNDPAYVFVGTGAPVQLTVILSPQSGGTVTSSPAGLVFSGSTGTGLFSVSVSLTATPATSCTFAYWDDGIMCSTSNPLTMNINSAETITSVFVCSLKWPLSDSKDDRTILLGFGDNWTESCNGQVMKHTGIDIAATEGETVYAAEAGTVKVAQTDSYYGGWVTLEHNSSNSPYTTVYWHINYSVSVNQAVAKGDPIGIVLNYGHGSAVHLHFGFRNSAYTNTSNRGRLPQSSCGGDPAYQENFLDPQIFTYE